MRVEDRVPAVRVEQISKCYSLSTQPRASTLRDALSSFPRKWLGGGRFRRRDGKGDFWALRDVSFEVPRGQVLGVIGRNGAGKSTLLKILSRITTPTRGRAVLNGRVRSLLEVGTGFHSELTGRENIFLNGAVLGMRRDEIVRRFDEIVAFAEVEPFLDTPVKHYSSGMRVRLAFAVAAHLRPEVLLVDEVLAVGDTAFQRKCMGQMRDVSRDGATVLFVTHDMAAVQTLCQRCLLLDHGQLVCDGAPAEVVAEYARANLSSTGGGGHWKLDTKVRRSGDGRARYTAIRLLDGAGNPVEEIAMGEAFGFDLEFELHQASLSAPSFGVGIRKLNGLLMLRCTTRETHGDAPPVTGSGCVRLWIDRPQLMPDRYVVTLGLSSAGASVDLVDDAMEFEVVPKPVYPTGKLPSNGALMFAPCCWNFDYPTT